MSPAVVYSARAKRDLAGIFEWTIERFGRAQADRYLAFLEDRCSELALHPTHARLHTGRTTGMRRMEHGSHVIFFTVDDPGITVQRILHQHQMPAKHRL